jgi:hypothetical protein
MRRHLVLIACLALGGTVASASPGHHHKKHKKHTVDEVAFAPETEEPAPVDDEVEMPEVHVHHHHHLVSAPRDWAIAIGPYLWASAVDANISIGSASVAQSVDFLQTTQQAKYGAEVLADARYGRLSLSGDLQYGVVGIGGGTSAGPVLVTVNGTAESVLVDGLAGYRLAGDEHSAFAIDARGGVRYQRIAIASAVDVDGTQVAQPGTVNAGRDLIAGTRVVLRPSSRFWLTGTADMGVYGSSSTTWSAAADASVRVSSHVLLSLGYRTLTIERSSVSMVMHGPRAALQLLF